MFDHQVINLLLPCSFEDITVVQYEVFSKKYNYVCSKAEWIGTFIFKESGFILELTNTVYFHLSDEVEVLHLINSVTLAVLEIVYFS